LTAALAWDASILGAFERRLDPDLAQPLAVGFSGGGDSLAALIAAKAWADRCGRRVLTLHLDHRLQPHSGAWAAFAAEAARRLGADFQLLSWDGPKPATGLPAAARAERHRLLAQAARAAGARAIVLGHTADDLIEAEVMRGWGAGLGALRDWSPSPAWPEGRGLFLLRPLLVCRRAALRAALAAAGERWIDDPANDDLRQMRARARAEIAGGGSAVGPAADDPEAAALAEAAEALTGGALRLERAALAGGAAARRVLAAAALSVGGGTQPARGARLDAVLVRLASGAPFRTTLRGARLIADARRLLVVRDAGEAKRGGLAPLRPLDQACVVWDGRFELDGLEPGASVQPLSGLAARLPKAERAALRATPAAARPGLPALVAADGSVTCPLLAGSGRSARDLVPARFRAACGAISKEPAA
jgi:tRNA(Ile)-lysidine synthase